MKQVTKSLVTLGVTGAIGGLIALFAYSRAGDVEDPKAKKDLKPLLFDVDADALTQIDIQRQGNLIRAVRTDMGWVIEKPRRTCAAEAEVRKLARLIEKMRPELEFGKEDGPPVPKPKLSGLDVPTHTVTATFQKGAKSTTVKIEVGDRSDFNRDYYARVKQDDGPERVVSINATNGGGLELSGGDLVDQRVMGADTDRIVKLTVEPRAPSEQAIKYTLERILPPPGQPRYQREQRFNVVEPDLGEADIDTAAAVFRALARAPAANRVTDDHRGELEKYGLDKPAYTVTAELVPLFKPEGHTPGDPLPTETRVLRISDPLPSGNVNATRDDETWVAECHPSLAGGLPRSADDLRSRRVLFFDRALVRRVEMDLSAAGHLTVEKTSREGDDEVTWRMLAPQPAPLLAHKVTALVLRFSQVIGQDRIAEGSKANDPAMLKKTGLDSPDRIRFLDEKGQELGTLLIGAPENADVAYAKAEGASLIVSIPRGHLNALPASASSIIDTR